MQAGEVPAAERPAPCPARRERLRPRGRAAGPGPWSPAAAWRHSPVSKRHRARVPGLPPVPGLPRGRDGQGQARQSRRGGSERGCVQKARLGPVVLGAIRGPGRNVRMRPAGGRSAAALHNPSICLRRVRLRTASSARFRGACLGACEEPCVATPPCFLCLTQRQGSKPPRGSGSEHPHPGGLPGALFEVPSTTRCWVC